jgi:hypothetical protein
MKYKMIALILALTVITWAQTATTAPSTPQPSTASGEKAKCSCCDKMAAADTKDVLACCARHGKHADKSKEAASCCKGKDASCCAGKDANSCMKGDKTAAGCCSDKCAKDKDETAAACCGSNCGKHCEKALCSGGKAEKAARNCCKDDLRSQNETTHSSAALRK